MLSSVELPSLNWTSVRSIHVPAWMQQHIPFQCRTTHCCRTITQPSIPGLTTITWSLLFGVTQIAPVNIFICVLPGIYVYVSVGSQFRNGIRESWPMQMFSFVACKSGYVSLSLVPHHCQPLVLSCFHILAILGVRNLKQFLFACAWWIKSVGLLDIILKCLIKSFASSSMRWSFLINLVGGGALYGCWIRVLCWIIYTHR